MIERSGKTATLVLGVVTAAFAVAFMGADGCASNADADPTPVQTWKITPAANRTSESTPAATVTFAPATSPTISAASGGAIVIEGINSEFDIEEISAAPGSITIEFDNRDSGVIHNIHFFEGDDNDGQSVAETELDVGPIKQTVTFDVAPGTYFYQCDAHPTTMEGILTVE